VHPAAAVRLQYSIWIRGPEAEVIPVCEEMGISFLPWGPLGTGFLTGTLDTSTTFDSAADLRANFPRFTQEAIKANMPTACPGETNSLDHLSSTGRIGEAERRNDVMQQQDGNVVVLKGRAGT
jgi:hypothetical protein